MNIQLTNLTTNASLSNTNIMKDIIQNLSIPSVLYYTPDEPIQKYIPLINNKTGNCYIDSHIYKNLLNNARPAMVNINKSTSKKPSNNKSTSKKPSNNKSTSKKSNNKK